MEEFNNLSLNDELNNFYSEEEQIGTETEDTKISIDAQDFNQDDEIIDSGVLFGSLSSSDFQENVHTKISFNTETLNPLENESNSDHWVESNEVVEPPDDKYPKDFKKLYGEGEWRPHKEKRGFFVRNERRSVHTRNTPDSSTNQSQLVIDLVLLFQMYSGTIFYHATSWNGAIEIINGEPRINKKHGDLAFNGAFYLNPDYANCYEWFFARNGVFRGEHAMLIFKFDPWLLDRKGEELSVGRWRQVLLERNAETCHVPWSLAPQDSEPDKVKRNKYPRPNKKSNGEIAMQLVVRCLQMCRELSKYLVGCIFYEKINSKSQASNAQRSDDRNHCSNKKRCSSSQTMTKVRDSKKSRRQ